MRVGLEEGAYRIGEESASISDLASGRKEDDVPPGGARGVLPATEGCFKGQLMSILALPFGTLGSTAGDERKKRGDEDGTFRRDAGDVACDCACCDRREAGEDIFTISVKCMMQLKAARKLFVRILNRRAAFTRSHATRKPIYCGCPQRPSRTYINPPLAREAGESEEATLLFGCVGAYLMQAILTASRRKRKIELFPVMISSSLIAMPCHA